MAKELDRIATGFGQRTLKTAKFASRIGLRYVTRAIKGAARELTDEQVERSVRTAESVVEELGALKGLVMKIGQIASYMPGAMPPEAQRVLARLQAKATPMTFENVREVVESEFGESPETIFRDFEPKPFAAASIGQVHRAHVNGTPVAVKVQYPGMEDVLRSDLRAVGTMVTLLSFGTALDAGETVEELRDRLLEECDYQLEAKNQSLFKDLWGNTENIRVPNVIGSHSSRRVLTTELIDAMDFQTFCDTANQADKDRAAAIIFRTCMDSIFRHCIYNADPHPGNYLFHNDETVTFLDFGCVRRFTPTFIDLWKYLALAVVNQDRKTFRDCCESLGFVRNPARFDWDHQWEITQYLYKPFLSTEPFTYTHDYVRRSYGMMLFDNPNQRLTAMPAEWLFLNRLQFGMNSVLAHLGATGPWPELWRRAIESKTVEPPA